MRARLTLMRALVCRVKRLVAHSEEPGQGFKKSQRTDRMTQSHRYLGLTQTCHRNTAEAMPGFGNKMD